MGNKIIVIYHSTYGSTERYARWIGERLGAEVCPLAKIKPAKLNEYETVIFGSSVHAGRIKRINFLKDNWEGIKEKKVVVFSVSMAPPEDPGIQQIFETNLPGEILEKVTGFSLRGAYNYYQLKGFDKFLMNGLKMMMKAKLRSGPDLETQEFLDHFYDSNDWTNEKAIAPILDCVRG